MKPNKQHLIVYLIGITVFATIAVQLYWNYKNYEQNKLRVINEVQQSLNDAIRDYFVNFSKENFVAFVKPKEMSKLDSLNTNIRLNKALFPSMFKDSTKVPAKEKGTFRVTSIAYTAESDKDFQDLDSVVKQVIKDVSKNHNSNHDLDGSTRMRRFPGEDIPDANQIQSIQVVKGKRAVDSLKFFNEIGAMYISIKNEAINIDELDTLIHKSLVSKKLTIPFYIKHFKKDTLFKQTVLKERAMKAVWIKKDAISNFIKEEEKIQLVFSNPITEALKRSIIGIILSLILSIAIIVSLLYLLSIINQQKHLAEIKNDLISNITHEFKTPITTVATALEAINNFNVIDDKEKTQKYLAMSSTQIKKLHNMVEKILETATLDSEKLLLKKEEINLVELLENTTQKFTLLESVKQISFKNITNELFYEVDVFHFENALSNLIDNAVKYGGDIIEVELVKGLSAIEIIVADNGKGIEKQQQEKIFDKFYRIPKGNTHDVKGFGIGLYYSQKIVEKHGGVISLNAKPNLTIFKISLPYE